LYYQEFEYHQGVKSWIPVQESGWLPYTGSSTNYDWRLVPFVGMHLLQVWAMDNAGNVSLTPFQSTINYVPPSDTLRLNQVRIYRQILAVGQTLTVVVTPISGDADLYVWAPDGTRTFSNLANSAIDAVILTASVAGMYQIEVHGYTATQYQLTMTVTSTKAMLMPLPLGGIDPNKDQDGDPECSPSSSPDNRMAVPSANLRQNWLPLVIR